jgi:uncharacterized protein (TIGR00661 family)
MRYLFAIQGEGRGHLTQALSLAGILRRNGHEVVGILVGRSPERRLPDFFFERIGAPVTEFEAPRFAFDRCNRSVSMFRTLLANAVPRRLKAFDRSMRLIRRRIEELQPDRIVNFYELLTGMTYLFFRPSVPQISVGHQYLFLHRDFEFPGKNGFHLWLLRLFTRLTCIGAREKLALSFREMEDDEEAYVRVVPPLLRREVLSCEGTEGDYLHGYMVNSGFGENILHWHSAHPEIPLHFFWDKQDEAEVCRVDDTLSFHQLDDVKFLRYMAGCKAYATTAGFESVCEAMYLGKPLLMVPAHIEQDCNAYDAFRSGAGVISEEFDLERLLDFSEHFHPNMAFRYWVRSCDWRILRCIEREEKEETFFGVSSSCRPFFPAT